VKDLLAALEHAIPAKRWLIALDRDGTLVPYASRPEDARVSPELSALMDELVEVPGCNVAIVSARSLGQLNGDFDGRKLILAGNYGLEVQFTDGSLVVQKSAQLVVPYLKQIRDDLSDLLGLNNGIILEDHGYSLCLHLRSATAGDERTVHDVVAGMVSEYPQVQFRRLPTSYEMLPSAPWDKGRALSFIDSQLSKRGEEQEQEQEQEQDWFYFFAGDTEADTPAFLWVAEHQGISVRVGGNGSLGARFHLAQPTDLHAMLKFLVKHRARPSLA
jgi:trehalose-phosphatase